MNQPLLVNQRRTFEILARQPQILTKPKRGVTRYRRIAQHLEKGLGVSPVRCGEQLRMVIEGIQCVAVDEFGQIVPEGICSIEQLETDHPPVDGEQSTNLIFDGSQALPVARQPVGALFEQIGHGAGGRMGVHTGLLPGQVIPDRPLIRPVLSPFLE